MALVEKRENILYAFIYGERHTAGDAFWNFLTSGLNFKNGGAKEVSFSQQQRSKTVDSKLKYTLFIQSVDN